MACKLREELISTLKVAFVSIRHENLKIFGFKKFKSLQMYVTTEKDIGKGINRMPLGLARMHDEDILASGDGDGAGGGAGAGDGGSSTADSAEEVQTTTGNFTNAECIFSRNDTNGKKIECKLEDFDIMKIMGRGAIGKFRLVKNRHTGEVYVMKTIRKWVYEQYQSFDSLKSQI